VDGQPASGLPAHDRGLAYGDGLFETILIRSGLPTLLDMHLARLQLGCERLAIPCNLSDIGSQLAEFSAQLGDGVAKLVVTRGEGQRGYALPNPCQPRVILIGAPTPRYPGAHAEQGIRLFPCVTRLAEQPALAGIKHLNRLEQVLARAEWQDAAFAEGLMRDTSGRVIEGVFSNLFIAESGVLLTPALERCGVAGVMRAEIIAQTQRWGVPVQVRDISIEQLLSADEVFVCNSLYGIWPVRQLEQRVWSVGPLTRKLQRSITIC
jgi:4-amino-4-deoxychorismate lyase